MLRNVYYVLRIIGLSAGVFFLFKGFLSHAYAQGGGLLGFGETLEIAVVPVLGVPEFDYFFNICVWFFLIAFMGHLIFRIMLRS